MPDIAGRLWVKLRSLVIDHLVPTLSNTETLELNLAYMLKVCLIAKPGHSVLA